MAAEKEYNDFYTHTPDSGAGAAGASANSSTTAKKSKLENASGRNNDEEEDPYGPIKELDTSNVAEDRRDDDGAGDGNDACSRRAEERLDLACYAPRFPIPGSVSGRNLVEIGSLGEASAGGMHARMGKDNVCGSLRERDAKDSGSTHSENALKSVSISQPPSSISCTSVSSTISNKVYGAKEYDEVAGLIRMDVGFGQKQTVTLGQLTGKGIEIVKPILVEWAALAGPETAANMVVKLC